MRTRWGAALIIICLVSGANARADSASAQQSLASRFRAGIGRLGLQTRARLDFYRWTRNNKAVRDVYKDAQRFHSVPQERRTAAKYGALTALASGGTAAANGVDPVNLVSGAIGSFVTAAQGAIAASANGKAIRATVGVAKDAHLKDIPTSVNKYYGAAAKKMAKSVFFYEDYKPIEAR